MSSSSLFWCTLSWWFHMNVNVVKGNIFTIQLSLFQMLAIVNLQSKSSIIWVPMLIQMNCNDFVNKTSSLLTSWWRYLHINDTNILKLFFKEHQAIIYQNPNIMPNLCPFHLNSALHHFCITYFSNQTCKF